MMADVDGLTRRFGQPISTHIAVAAILRKQDLDNQPKAYDPKTFTAVSKSTKIKSPTTDKEPLPILTTELINNTDATQPDPSVEIVTPHKLVTSTPTHITSQLSTTTSKIPMNNFNTLHHPCHVAEVQHIQWVTINDCAQTIAHWTRNDVMPQIKWLVTQYVTHPKLRALSSALQLPSIPAIQPLQRVLQPKSELACKAHVMDIVFTPYTDGSIYEWTHLLIFWLSANTESPIALINFWISPQHTDPKVLNNINDTISSTLPPSWECHMSSYQFASYHIPIASHRICFHFSRDVNAWTSSTPSNDQSPAAFESCVQLELNTDSNSCPLIIPSAIFDNPPSTIHQPQPVVHLQPHDATTSINSHCSNILDFRCPVTKPNTTIYNEFFGHRFEIPFQNSIGTWTARRAATQELTKAYTLSHTSNPIASYSIGMESDIDYNFTVCLPANLLQSLITHDGPFQSLLHQYLYTDDESHTTAHCLTISSQPAPQTLNWTSAYGEDPDTAEMTELMLRYGHSK